MEVKFKGIILRSLRQVVGEKARLLSRNLELGVQGMAAFRNGGAAPGVLMLFLEDPWTREGEGMMTAHWGEARDPTGKAWFRQRRRDHLFTEETRSICQEVSLDSRPLSWMTQFVFK